MNAKFKFAFGLAFLWNLVVLAILGGLVYAAVHFVSKYW